MHQTRGRKRAEKIVKVEKVPMEEIFPIKEDRTAAGSDQENVVHVGCGSGTRRGKDGSEEE